MDRELISRAAAGDDSAFQVLYERYWKAVYSYAWLLTKSIADAEDITQESFLVLIRKPAAFDPARAQLRTWLIAIVRRQYPVFRIRGKVTGGNVDYSNLDLVLLPKVEGGFGFGQGYDEVVSRRVGGSRAVHSDGTFELGGVERGSYDLAAVAMSGRDREHRGWVTVTVQDRDVEDTVLPLGGLVRLSVKLQSDQDIKAVSCGIIGHPLYADPGVLTIIGTTGPDGVFTYERANPARYALRAKCRPGDWAIQSARLGEGIGAQDVLDRGMDLTGISGPVAVNLILSRDTGVVLARVKDGEAPAPGRWVTLIPDPPQPGRMTYEMGAWSDEDGRVVLTGVAPGDYRVSAWLQARLLRVLLTPGF